MKLKTTIFALFVITNLQNAYGEGNDSNGKSFYNIPTPNASELMKIGNIPVNCHTGSANISIPLYSYNYGGVPLDISLQYDATGLPMNRLPGWTGQGWTLIAGGSITRNKIGRPDDISYKGTQIRPKDQIAEHYFKNHSISTAYDGDAGPDMFYFNFLGKSGRFFLGSDGDWKVISDDIIDVQTDVSDESNYIYPFIQKIHLTNSEALAPVINYPKTIKGFTLVDGNGVQYTFGGGTGSIEYSSPLLQIHDLNYYKASETNPEGNPFVTPNMFWCADTWMLTDVKDRFGNSLYAFFYDRGKFIYQLSKNAYSPATKDYGALLKGDYTGVVNAPVYLCSIAINGGEKSIHFGSENAFPNEPASRTLYPSFYDNSGNPKWNTALPSHYPFLYAQSTQENVTPFHAYYPNVSTQTDPLSSMEIDLLKIIKADNEVSYSLHYDYNSRIHLSSVQMYEKSEILSGYVSGSIGEYKLLYYDYTNVPSNYLTDCIDYWGYCNSTSTVGKNLHRANQNQDPNTPLNPNPGTGGSENANTDGEKSFIYLWYNRPNINCGRKGMLSDIVYPTGGRTHFEYEQNTCSKYTIQKNGIFHVKAASDFEVAGLRIKRISNWENEYIENGTPLSSFNYDYNLEGRSSGDLYHIPNNCVDRYMQEPRLSLNDEIMHQERTGSAIIEYDYGASFGGNINSLTPLWDNRGPHMGYESVTVSDLEGNSKVHKYCGH